MKYYTIIAAFIAVASAGDLGDLGPVEFAVHQGRLDPLPRPNKVDKLVTKYARALFENWLHSNEVNPISFKSIPIYSTIGNLIRVTANNVVIYGAQNVILDKTLDVRASVPVIAQGGLQSPRADIEFDLGLVINPLGEINLGHAYFVLHNTDIVANFQPEHGLKFDGNIENVQLKLDLKYFKIIENDVEVQRTIAEVVKNEVASSIAHLILNEFHRLENVAQVAQAQ